MPKIALFLGEFDRHFLFLVTVLGVDVDDTAFSLFLRKAIHEPDRLAALYSGCQGQQRAIHIHGFSYGHVTKWQASLSVAVYVNRNREWEPLAAPFIFHSVTPEFVWVRF